MRRAVLVGLAVTATLGCVAGALFGGMEGGDALWPMVWIFWAPVGALILIQRPGNGVGLAMLATGMMWGLGFLFLTLAASELPIEVRVWAELVNSLLGILAWLGIIWVILVFPSGRLVGWLSRLTALGFVTLGVLGVFAFTFTTLPMEATGRPSPFADETLSEYSNWFVGEGGFYVVIALVVMAIFSAGLRWYRSDGLERHQYRWLLLGSLVFVSITAMAQFLPEDSPGEYLWLLSGAAIPLSIGVAVTRYRLYEIDRIISRTLGYAVVVGLLVGGVALAAALVGTRFDDPLAVAATTLGVAAVFNPLRRRVQSLIDRRFNRSKYDAERVTETFAASLRDRTNPDGVVDGWVDVVAKTMQPSVMGVWMRR